MSFRLHNLVALFLSVLLSSACSSDSGGSEQSTLSGVPRPISDDATSTMSAGSETPTTTTTTTTPPETTTTPADPDVRNLIGNVRFEFRFSDSSDIFTLEKTFVVDEAGVDQASGAAFVQTGIGTTIVMRCLILPDGLPYFCAEATATSATAVSFRLFRFNLDSARSGTGTFEFCPAGTTAEQCTVDAFTTPDGDVTVSVDPVNAVAVATLDIGLQRIDTDVVAHQLVSEQAHSTWNGAYPATGSTNISRPAMDMLSLLLSSIELSSLNEQ